MRGRECDIARFGVLFFLSTFTIVVILPVSKTWYVVGVAVVVAAVAAGLMTLVNISARAAN